MDDLAGNALLSKLGTLVYQMLHSVRSPGLSRAWRTAIQDRLRAWLFRVPGRFTDYARKIYLQIRGDEPLRGQHLRALGRTGRLRDPPLITARWVETVSSIARATYVSDPDSAPRTGPLPTPGTRRWRTRTGRSPARSTT